LTTDTPAGEGHEGEPFLIDGLVAVLAQTVVAPVKCFEGLVNEKELLSQAVAEEIGVFGGQVPGGVIAQIPELVAFAGGLVLGFDLVHDLSPHIQEQRSKSFLALS
jgi:hypothetical protein